MIASAAASGSAAQSRRRGRASRRAASRVGQAHADHAGRGGEHRLRGDLERRAEIARSPPRTSAHALGTGERVRVAAVDRPPRARPRAAAAPSSSRIGAAFALFTVRHAAAAHGTSLYDQREVLADRLDPGVQPGEEKPRRRLHGWNPRSEREPEPFLEPEHQVEVLHRLTGGALHQVVDRRATTIRRGCSALPPEIPSRQRLVPTTSLSATSSAVPTTRTNGSSRVGGRERLARLGERPPRRERRVAGARGCRA